jgi:hypothetical protein
MIRTMIMTRLANALNTGRIRWGGKHGEVALKLWNPRMQQMGQTQAGEDATSRLRLKC